MDPQNPAKLLVRKIILSLWPLLAFLLLAIVLIFWANERIRSQGIRKSFAYPAPTLTPAE